VTVTERARADEAPPVAVVVVNWNGFADTAACVDSHADLDYPDCRTVVVDNGSSDDSAARLAAAYGDDDGVTLVENDANRGFAGGVNAGAERALADGAAYVLLLNNDARLERGALDELVAVAEESGADVVGATVVDGDGERVNPAPSRHPDAYFYSGYRDRLPFVSDAPDPDARWWETDRVEGAGALLSADLLRARRETVGQYLDESLFMYCEEVELGAWARRHGRRSVVAADAVVRHEGGASSSRAFQLYYLSRNRVLVAHRYLGGARRLLFDLAYPPTRLARAARFAVEGRLDVARAVVAGLVDGYRHREGRTE
jgi:GT2 family glycosyltransferase